MGNSILHKTDRGRTFWCPGCDCAHHVRVNDPAGGNWTMGGTEECPTFNPSILVRGTRPNTDDEIERMMRGEKIEPVPTVCHSFVEGGNIRFLSDCTHSLAGQTVPLKPF